MTSQIVLKRINKELNDLDKQPRPGITCYPVEDNITQLEAIIEGPPESPYEQGLFKLSVQIPDRYPFEPPQIKFITRIYHPNIDDGGRICADILKTGEKGKWNPAINIGTALMSLRQLIATPNPDDPLEVDIAQEFKLDYPTFQQKAREFTKKYATGDDTSNNVNSITTQELEDELPEIEDDAMDIVEEKPKKFLSLSKKKAIMSSNSQSSVSQCLKEDKEDTKESKNLLPKSGKVELYDSLSQNKTVDIIDPVITIDKVDIGLSKSKENHTRISLLDDEDTNMLSKEEDIVMVNKKSILKKKSKNKEEDKEPVVKDVDEDANSIYNEKDDMVIVKETKVIRSVLKKKSKNKEVSKKLNLDTVDEVDNNINFEEDMVIIEDPKSKKADLKKKSKDKDVSKKPVLNAVDNKKSTIKKAAKRKANELDEEEEADLKKCPNTKYPLKKPEVTSSKSSAEEKDLRESNSSKDLELPKMETSPSRTIDLVDETNKEDDFIMDEDITSLKVNDSDIASNAIDIIKSSMMTYNNNNVGNRDIIELSDDDDNDIDLTAQSPKYHSFSLSKKSHKPKISLSRKKRSS